MFCFLFGKLDFWTLCRIQCRQNVCRKTRNWKRRKKARKKEWNFSGLFKLLLICEKCCHFSFSHIFQSSTHESKVTWDVNSARSFFASLAFSSLPINNEILFLLYSKLLSLPPLLFPTFHLRILASTLLFFSPLSPFVSFHALKRMAKQKFECEFSHKVKFAFHSSLLHISYSFFSPFYLSKRDGSGGWNGRKYSLRCAHYRSSRSCGDETKESCGFARTLESI